MGKKGAPGLASQFEPLYLKIPPSIIQEENDTQESQQGQKTPPLCCLTIWECPTEVMEYQGKTLRWIYQEALRK